MCIERRSKITQLLKYAIFLFAFLLYLKTSAPEVFTADCGEMAATSYVLGIPHPTGYPLYNQLNKLVSLAVPMGSIAFRCALFSAVITATAIVLLFDLLLVCFSPLAAMLGSTIMMSSFTIWSQANIQEVYGLHLFFLVLLLNMGLKYFIQPDQKTLRLFALVTGLAVTHHLLAVFALPALGLFFISFDRKRVNQQLKLFLSAIPFFLLGTSQILYFPLRSISQCPIRWMPCHTLWELKYHITGQQFRTMMFNVSLQSLSDNIIRYCEKLSNQTYPFFIGFAVIGFIVLFFRYRKIWLICSVMFICVAAFFLTYRIVDIEVYYIQSYLPYFIFITAGVDWLTSLVVSLRKNWLCYVGVILAAVAISGSIVRSFYYNDRSRGWVAYDWGKSIYDSCPVDSVLVTQGWSSPFVFFYLDHVEGYRSDILMHVDYKGVTFSRFQSEKWDTSIVSTVPVEIPEVSWESFAVSGHAYRFKRLTEESLYPFSWCRDRSFDDGSIFLDYHGLGFKAKWSMMRGESSFVSGNMLEGFRHLADSEKYGIENPLILSNLSGVYFKQRSYDSAERLARDAIALDPSFYPAYHNLGNALMKQGRYGDALDAFLEVDDSSHALGRQREALGYAYLQEDRCHEALAEFRRAIDTLPSSFSARIGRGVALHKCGHYQQALHDFNWVLEREPHHIDAGLNQSLALIQLQRMTEAEHTLSALLHKYPDLLEVSINLAVVYCETNRISEGCELLEKQYRLNSKNITLLNNLALSWYLNGDLNRAEHYWHLSLAEKPNQPHVRNNLHRLKLPGDVILFD